MKTTIAMKQSLGALALLAVTASADLCSSGSMEFLGNYYCAEVDAITYTGIGGAGSYDKITNMDSSSGSCSSTPFGYSGSLSPLDEEVSLHHRGPFNLKQFAVYTPGHASTKKPRRSQHVRRHAGGNAHEHLHHANRIKERQVGATVTATIDGVVDTWINSYSGGSGDATSSETPSSEATSASSTADSYSALSSSHSAPPLPSQSIGAGSIGSSSGSWGRQAYYNAESGTSDGLVFLNHYGGDGSGVFDYTFGNSLSYSSADGTCGSSTPQILADTTLPSSAEVVIMSDRECSGDDCGYTRPGGVAYHGFDGAEKAFFYEFEMPNDGQTTSDPYDPVNMPALWMLNAQIPRTLQYGNPECSCWTSGCGEFDIFEILSPGYNKAKSTLHGNKAGGDSDWFQRPETGSIKLAVVLYNNNIHIKILPSSTEFPSTMDTGTISEICGSTSIQDDRVSLFRLGDATGD